MSLTQPQTSYSRNPVAAFAGQLGDNREGIVISSRLNAESVNMPAGVFVKQTAGSEGKANNIAAAADVLAGIVLNTFSRNPGDIGLTLSGTDAYGPGMGMPLLEQGSAWVVCEQSMAVGDPVYVRFSANGAGKLVVGAVRKDADGVAQVTTLTPTAVNSTIYVLDLELSTGKRFTLEYISDSTATAAEIVTGFTTLINANADLTAEITPSGSTTLILTGVTAGKSFKATSSGDGTLAVAATTPPAAHARLCKGARVERASTAAAGVVQLVFSQMAELAAQVAVSQ